MTKCRPLFCTVGIGIGLLLAVYLVIAALPGFAQDNKPTPLLRKLPLPPPDMIGDNAERILREMGEYLRKAKEFTFRTEVVYDTLLANDQKIQYSGRANISVHRPDKLLVWFDGEERRSRIFYDGKTFTILDARMNVYSVTDVLPTIDDAVDQIVEMYGFSPPIADFVYTDPYKVLIENVDTGFTVGQSLVDGVNCYHLAFTQDVIDWQIWIEQGGRPVPRKLVITYKQEPGSPQYAARLSDWNFQPRLAENGFTFHPPDGADKIDFLKPRWEIGGEENETE